MNKIPTLYHYCSSSAFVSIIRSRCVWLSDFTSLNDSQEVEWTHALTRSALAARPSEERDRVLEGLAAYPPKLYVGCFSEDGDLLGQWRGYAADGSGFAIGFCPTAFEWVDGVPYPSGSSDVVGLTSVIYDRLTQEKEVRRIIAEVFAQERSKDWFVGGGILRQMSVCFKNPSFKEEREWRFVHFPYLIEDDPEDPDKPLRFESRGVLGPLHFRATDRGVVSYFQYPFRMPHCIHNVIIGPKNPGNENTVLSLLRSQGYRGVKVHRSQSSYR
jgi:hypothetical protein